MSLRLALWAVLGLSYAPLSQAADLLAKMLSPPQKISQSQDGYASFTGLVHHQDAYYLTYRSSDKHHLSVNSAIVVLRSRDGHSWQRLARFTAPEADLRDPKMVVLQTAQGERLILTAAKRWSDDQGTYSTTMVYTYDGNNQFTEQEVPSDNRWIWHMASYGQKHWGAAYGGRSDGLMTLYAFDDQFNRLGSFDFGAASVQNLRGNETFLFADSPRNRMVALMRGASEGSAAIGFSQPGGMLSDRAQWRWHDTGRFIGGPSVLVLPGGEVLASGRIFMNGDRHHTQRRTALLQIDPNTGASRVLLVLPSRSDTGYTGMVYSPSRGEVLLSYYSNYDVESLQEIPGRSHIYTVRIGIEPLPVAPPAPPVEPVQSASDLSSCGRYIVDASGRRVKLASVNWFGASDTVEIPLGLNKRHRQEIAAEIRAMGFNSVRLPFSNNMMRTTGAAPSDWLTENQDLIGSTPLEVLDAVIEALSAEGLYVILNSHTTISRWCCTRGDEDGLWFDETFTEAEFMADWLALAQRYRHHPYVVGADLRNELRRNSLGQDASWAVPPRASQEQRQLAWQRAAEELSRQIYAVNPRLLLIIEGLDLSLDFRSFEASPPFQRPLDPRNVVYSPHSYNWNEPVFADYGASSAYWDERWGYLMNPGQPYTFPVWIGEFGSDLHTNPARRHWWQLLMRYLEETDIGFAYWPLNGEKVDSPETFGLLDDTWHPHPNDWRLQDLQAVMQARTGPGIDEPLCVQP